MRSVADQLHDLGVDFDVFSFNGFNPKSAWSAFCSSLYVNREISLTELLVRKHYDVVNMLEDTGPAPYSGNLWLERAGYEGAIVCVSQNSIHKMQPEHFAHVYIACSQASRDSMARFVSKPIRIIHNGVDTARFYPRPVRKPPRPILGWVGRATDLKQKDVFGFLHLAAALAEEQYDFRIVDAGGAAEMLRLSDWFGARVRYDEALEQEQLTEFYCEIAASGGALVSTSAYEGLPFVLLEASACHCPVIAPRAPGLEYLVDGETALLYDRMDGLIGAKRCVRQLSSENVRRRLADRGKRAIDECYNSRIMAKGYLQAYHDAVLMAAAGSRRAVWKKMRGAVMAAGIRAKRLLR